MKLIQSINIASLHGSRPEVEDALDHWEGSIPRAYGSPPPLAHVLSDLICLCSLCSPIPLTFLSMNFMLEMPSSIPQTKGDYVYDESTLPGKSPVYAGSTKFEPLAEVRVILITGGAGFIASWLVRHLCLTYPTAYHVVCFDKLDYCASLNNIQCVQGRKSFSFCYGDITNKTEVMRCLKKYQVDTIFHFAAQSHVDLSFGNSFQFTTTNVLGTHVMLECAVDHGIRRFIHISTDEVNGEVNFGDPDLLENSLLAPTNPYAASKAAAEMFVNAYAKSFKLPVMIIRSNNVYGPHQFPESK
jgi:FlaA1/EpsC-like NDP-sugar epimerase